MATNKAVPELIIALPKKCSVDKLRVFELPNPSNIESKRPVKVFVHNGSVFQLKTKSFSQGCEFNRARDSANESYHYTSREEPLKSGILVNNTDRQDGWLLSKGSFEFSTPYDLGFSLCGALFADLKSKDENQYQQADPAAPSVSLENRFLMTRDFLGDLIDHHSPNWSEVPAETLRTALEQLSECVEEGGDLYFKTSPVKITQWLATKVGKIISSFPESVPIPRNLPEEMQPHFKAVFACNLLISLVPRQAYHNLIQHEGENLNLAEAFRQYKRYQEEENHRQKEQELLIESAMKVGIGNGPTKKPIVRKVTKVVKTNKIKTGKGAIDGFFKKKVPTSQSIALQSATKGTRS
ncbi:LAME_0H09582g1_1 [Lachancea meyersii CBS 8951]|uniref:Ribonuclease H2 subunit B n=1 Tax=Lachancea meyersii CBS 8951 TaxID=1266667 RepID=A0A1G4KFR9_9SACH|nr:LAME_0H09582g1_1 [Lachancea meyersii CBS 8951]